MSSRQLRATAVRVAAGLVLAVVATNLVGRPAFGARATDRVDRGVETGVEWRATMKDGPWDLAGDRRGIVVTTSASSVSAFSADGRVQWRTPVDDLALGQPALSADLAIVGGERTVTALARADGTLRWRHPTVDQARSLAIAGDTVLVGDDTGTLAALDAATGSVRWSSQHPGALWSGARVDHDSGAVVATWHQTTNPAVRVFDLATGVLRWEAPTGRYSAAPVVRAGSVVVAIGDGNRNARVEARDLVTGAVRWQTPVPASFEEAIEPAADDDLVVVVDHFGVVTVLDLASGAIRWQHDLAEVVLATRVLLSEERVAFTSYRGVLSVLDRGDGRLVARLGPDRLGGQPVATLRTPGAGGVRGAGRMLLAVRLHDWGVHQRRLP